jgi:hypothetical protein
MNPLAEGPVAPRGQAVQRILTVTAILPRYRGGTRRAGGPSPGTRKLLDGVSSGRTAFVVHLIEAPVRRRWDAAASSR